jgi:homogentisate 1,2-dioxygenase
VIRTKKRGMLYNMHYGTHPFDVVGWDGCCYPFAFSIHDFEPITGRVHQPPPVHQTFRGQQFCGVLFLPRLFDYHPQSIPAPYNHSNIDSDEVLYYVDGDFMSRKNVTRGMITLHPAGIPARTASRERSKKASARKKRRNWRSWWTRFIPSCSPARPLISKTIIM